MNELDLIEHIRDLSERMLVAARQQRWQQLTELSNSITQLSHYSDTWTQRSTPLNDAQKQTKSALIKQIFANDRSIRAHSEPPEPPCLKIPTASLRD